jgi:hypothetical protein
VSRLGRRLHQLPSRTLAVAIALLLGALCATTTPLLVQTAQVSTAGHTVSSTAAARSSARFTTAADEGRTITITGYAVCTSHEGRMFPSPSACSSVRLHTSDGHNDSASSTKSSFPNEKGRFTFTNVPIPGRTEGRTMNYDLTAVRGSSLSSDPEGGTCAFSGSITGWTFQLDTLDLFNPVDHGPWTLASQCDPKP